MSSCPAQPSPGRRHQRVRAWLAAWQGIHSPDTTTWEDSRQVMRLWPPLGLTSHPPSSSSPKVPPIVPMDPTKARRPSVLSSPWALIPALSASSLHWIVHQEGLDSRGGTGPQHCPVQGWGQSSGMVCWGHRCPCGGCAFLQRQWFQWCFGNPGLPEDPVLRAE